MLKPFAPPPPSSFGVLPACTVSLSDPLFLFPFLIKNPCGREGKTQTGVTSRGLFGGVGTAATSTTRMGKSRKSWLASGESLFRLLTFVEKVTKVI